MANFMKAYTIAFESDDTVYSTDIMGFLKKIENLMKSEQRNNIVRAINGKIMRVHAYEWSDLNEDYVVIPFGKLKETNKPYIMDKDTQKLIEFEDEMFDVNCLAYHKRYNIALVTTNQQGPSEYDIENYMNSFFPPETSYSIKLTPIKRNIGIEVLRNAEMARSLTLLLDLGRPLNDFFNQRIEEDHSINGYLKGLMTFSKETLVSKTFSITLGLGREKNCSLDKDALLELLDSINIDSNCVKEIYVNYKNKTKTRIDTAKLKESNTIYRVYFDIKTSRLSSEYIKINLDERLSDERTQYYHQVSQHFSDAKPLEGGYVFEEKFNERPI